MSNAPNQATIIAAELRALGEEPPTKEELQFNMAGAGVLKDADVRTVTALIDIGRQTGDPEADRLQGLARRRVWKRVRARTIGDARGWHWAVAVAVVAAGLLLIPQLTPSVGNNGTALETREGLEMASRQAHAALQRLPGTVGGARAHALASDYERRFHMKRMEP